MMTGQKSFGRYLKISWCFAKYAGKAYFGGEIQEVFDKFAEAAELCAAAADPQQLWSRTQNLRRSHHGVRKVTGDVLKKDVL